MQDSLVNNRQLPTCRQAVKGACFILRSITWKIVLPVLSCVHSKLKTPCNKFFIRFHIKQSHNLFTPQFFAFDHLCVLWLLLFVLFFFFLMEVTLLFIFSVFNMIIMCRILMDCKFCLFLGLDFVFVSGFIKLKHQRNRGKNVLSILIGIAYFKHIRTNYSQEEILINSIMCKAFWRKQL